jgi:signal transduction histidine kinase/ActR/RegA family two-component response regulator
MFKWGLFKEDLADMDVPNEIKRQMKSIYSEFPGSDPVVLVLDQLSQLIQEQRAEMDASIHKAEELEMRLEETYREKNFQADLLTSMCDEIQAPIHTIIQVGDWLDQTHLDPTQKVGFDLYRKTGRKLNDLFKNIIDVAKLREGILQLDPISFQLKYLVRDIEQGLSLTAQEKGISLTVKMDADIPQYLVGDMKRLEQVMISLINNAIKFSYEGEVRVLIQKERDNDTECAINFLVMDSGMGIPENQSKHIFDRLAQGDPDIERNFGGTGLGLYICKNLVEQMGGTIWAENRKEGGATFGFGIRFEKDALKEVEEELLLNSQLTETEDSDSVEEIPEIEVPEVAVAADNKVNNSKLKILVVDDCIDTCRLIELFLEKSPYEVVVVNDGGAALEKHATGEYDLILMDIQLPDTNGVSATIEIHNRESESASKTPIFALVGNSSEADGSFLSADFDQYLIKPISESKLLEAINELNIPDNIIFA